MSKEKTCRVLEFRTGSGEFLFSLQLIEKDEANPEQPKVEKKPPAEKGGDGKKEEAKKAPNPNVNDSMMSDAQKRYLFRILAEQGVENEAAHEELKKSFGVDSLKKVTKLEASREIERRLEAQKGVVPMVEYTIDHLSASQINLYIQCGLKYRFQYVDLIPRPFKSSGLVFGSVVHSTIEWFQKQRKIGKQVSLETLYKILGADWFCQKLDKEIRYKGGERRNKLILTAKEMISLYFNSPLNGVEDAEFPFRVPIINPVNGERLEVVLEGFIDLIEKDDVLTEFKTSAKTMDSQSLDDILQLTSYSYAYRVLFGKEPQLLRVVNFVKTKTPKMVVLETGREEKDYERLFYLAKDVLKGIKSGVFFPRQSFMCKDCEYEAFCQKWQGNK